MRTTRVPVVRRVLDGYQRVKTSISSWVLYFWRPRKTTIEQLKDLMERRA